MSEEKSYYVPEQLDDDDFEKEKLEEKQKKKNKKFEFNKKQILKIISLLLVIALIVVGIYLYLNPIQKKGSAPEQVLSDFCAYLNSGNWKKVNKLIDFKGCYILDSVLEEKDYTKFDDEYKNLSLDDEKYTQFMDAIEVLTGIDEDTLNSYTNFQIKINSIDSCNLIQNTKTLYKLKVNYDYIMDGKSQSGTGFIYVSNASGEYKLAFGDWVQTILNYYSSVYTFNSNYGY